MQRLFSTFANGWPGFGLLLQRLVLGITLLCHGIALLGGVPGADPVLPQLIGCALALFILAGLWTPPIGALIAVVEVWIAFAHLGGMTGLAGKTGARDPSVSILLAVLGGTLAMIGPGAWSLDARLFGRKHISG